MEPIPEHPVLFGEPVPQGELLPRSWARDRPERARDRDGTVDAAFPVRPRVVCGWEADLRAPTRWPFRVV